MDLSRRKWLRLSALGVVGTAGCASDPRFSAAETPPGGQTETGAAGVAGASAEGSTPTEHPLPAPEDFCSADAAIDDEDPLTVSFDARERLKCTGAPLDNFESLDDWEADAGSLARDEEHAFSGSQSARVEAGRDVNRARVYRQFPGGLDLSGQDLSIAVKLDAPPSQGIVVRLDAPDYRNTMLMGRHVWQSGWVRLDLGPQQVIGSPDLTDVREISVQAYTGGRTEARFSVDSLRLRPRSGSGRVLLTFNDAMLSQYEQAFPVMEEYGFPGVVGVTPGHIHWNQKISMTGLRELQAAGWDVVSNPETSENFRSLSPERQTSRIRESKQRLVENGFERGANFLVWPQGRYNRPGLRAASRYHHLGFAGGGTPFGTVSEPLVLGRLDGKDVDTVQRALDFAAEYDQTVAVAYNAVGNMRTGMSLEGFEETLAYIDELGLEVVTASGLWESLR